jgi:hypothetical protein
LFSFIGHPAKPLFPLFPLSLIIVCLHPPIADCCFLIQLGPYHRQCRCPVNMTSAHPTTRATSAEAIMTTRFDSKFDSGFWLYLGHNNSDPRDPWPGGPIPIIDSLRVLSPDGIGTLVRRRECRTILPLGNKIFCYDHPRPSPYPLQLFPAFTCQNHTRNLATHVVDIQMLNTLTTLTHAVASFPSIIGHV